MPLDLSAIDKPAPPSAFVAPPLKQGIGWGWLAAPIAGNAVDAASTISGMGKGGRETNPFVAPIADNEVVLIAAKLGIGVAEAAGVKKLAESHPKLAKVLSAIMTAAPVAAAVHNFRVKKKP